MWCTWASAGVASFLHIHNRKFGHMKSGAWHINSCRAPVHAEQLPACEGRAGNLQHEASLGLRSDQRRPVAQHRFQQTELTAAVSWSQVISSWVAARLWSCVSACGPAVPTPSRALCQTILRCINRIVYTETCVTTGPSEFGDVAQTKRQHHPCVNSGETRRSRRCRGNQLQ